MVFVKDAARIRAITAPADAVLPQAGRRELGLVLLDTRFPRPLGDAGNPASWPLPVRTRVVAGAWPARVVTDADALRESGLAARFTQAMRELRDSGCTRLTTSCGFLVLLQEELQLAVDIPVITSSLLLLPALLARERAVGVLTISAQRLGADHLLAAGVPRERLPDVVVQGVAAEGEFVGAILGNRETMDLALARQEVVQAACALSVRAPRLETLVLECTNLPPYADAVRAATGLRVLSLVDAVLA